MNNSKLKIIAKRDLLRKIISEGGIIDLENVWLISEIFREEKFDVPAYVCVLKKNGNADVELHMISSLEEVYSKLRDKIINISIVGANEIRRMIEDGKLDGENISEVIREWALLTIKAA